MPSPPPTDFLPPDLDDRPPLTVGLMVGLVIFFFAVRVWLSATLNLTPDEAYYWLWSRHLDWSYFDHPPMLAYGVRLMTDLFGTSALTVRLVAHLSVAASLGLLIAAGRDLLGRTIHGLTAALVLSTTPLLGVFGFLTTPDAPLILFWSLALYAWGRLAVTGRGPWWLLIGLAVGLGFLAKYTMVLLPVSLGLWVLVSARGRKWLLTPWPYLAGLVALAGTLPVVIWNARHDWISLAWQAGHGLGGRVGLSLTKFLEYLGAQAGLMNPIWFGLMLAGAWVLGRRGRRERRDGPLIVGLAVWPPLVLFAVTSLLGQRVQPNWPTPAYLAAALAVGPLAGRRWRRRAIQVGVGLGAVLALVLQVHLVQPYLPVPVQDDRGYEFHLGPQFGARVRNEIAGRRLAGRVFLLSDKHQILAWAAFYGDPAAPALDLTQPWRYLYLPRLLDLAGRDALLLTRQSPAQVRLTYGHGFRSITPLPPIRPVYRGRVITEYACRLYLLSTYAGVRDYWFGPAGWPIPPRSRAIRPRPAARPTRAP